MADRVAAAKKRIEALNAKMANPYLSGTGAMPKSESPAPAPVPAGSSLSSSVALHPLLMGDSGGQQSQEKNEKKALRDRYKTMAPKFTSVRANASVAAASSSPSMPSAPAPIMNPDASTPPTGSPAPDEPSVRERKSRKMQFARPGKYVAQGDALRNEIKMEALRQRIAEASKKAGLDSEFDTLERSLKVRGRSIAEYVRALTWSSSSQRQPPPEVEWWDRALMPDGSSYDDIDKAVEWVTTSEDSLITHLIQHPIPIPAPMDKKQDERGLMLTKKEQKKMRRQRRQAELEDKRDRQKMGLLPPDPPKGELACRRVMVVKVFVVRPLTFAVRLANLMKVLTSDAVQDPTKVEARVRREVQARADKHEQDNSERKLTAEQRKEKEYQQMLAKERKGLYGAVFK
jgi:U4/U6 small nuclear ribonucleoprotein PRP3